MLMRYIVFFFVVPILLHFRDAGRGTHLMRWKIIKPSAPGRAEFCFYDVFDLFDLLDLFDLFDLWAF